MSHAAEDTAENDKTTISRLEKLLREITNNDRLKISLAEENISELLKCAIKAAKEASKI